MISSMSSHSPSQSSQESVIFSVTRMDMLTGLTWIVGIHKVNRHE